MGRDNVKKSYRNSVSRLALYRNISVLINVAWLLATMFLYSEEDGGGYGVGTWCGLTFWFGQEYAMVALLNFHFSPTKDASGNILDCNDVTDAATLGYFSYAQDCLFVCWFVQVLSLVSRYFYLIYLIVPMYATFKIISFGGPHLMKWLLASDKPEGGGGGGGQRSLAQRRAEAGKRRF